MTKACLVIKSLKLSRVIHHETAEVQTSVLPHWNVFSPPNKSATIIINGNNHNRHTHMAKKYRINTKLIKKNRIHINNTRHKSANTSCVLVSRRNSIKLFKTS